MHKQTIQAQRGEIEFRRKLAIQHVGGTTVLNDEFSSQEMMDILKERMIKTKLQVEIIKKRNIIVSPYLEVGAERGQRSLILESELGLNGAAADISYDMLKTTDYYQKVFNKPKTPFRVCCDVHCLPFLSASIPFVFCYQFLHHFSSPAEPLHEMYRVLSSGGTFFFDEEPYKKTLHLNLYNRKIYAKETLNSGKLRKWFDYFFAREIKNEDDYGIVENDQNSLRVWKTALRIFEKREVTIKTLHNMSADLFEPKSIVNFVFSYLCGGTISGLCQKSGSCGEVGQKTIVELLICPSCLEGKREIPIKKSGLFFICSNCHKKYPIKNDIAFLLPYNKFKELYPDEFKGVTL